MKKFSEEDIAFMERALQIARKAQRVSPNPRVGAVIVKNGMVLAEAYHQGPGKAHAEAAALAKLKGKAKGATLYLTLEPCCHSDKRTPPCLDNVIASGIKRIVIGAKDPNPKVNGKSIQRLKKNKIKVDVGCLEEESTLLIRAYHKWILTQEPWVILKSAITLDGKIATHSGEAHWITGENSRKRVHEIRAVVDAVVVGYNTILQDDPALTVRMKVKGTHPARVILDSHLRLPLSAKVFQNADKIPTFVACLESEKDNLKVEELKNRSVQILWCTHNSEGRVNLAHLFKQLGAKQYTRVLVEGGSVLASSLIQQKYLDELLLFVAPKLLGGQGLDLFSELKVDQLSQSPRFEFSEVMPYGEDLMLRLFPCF